MYLTSSPVRGSNNILLPRLVVELCGQIRLCLLLRRTSVLSLLGTSHLSSRPFNRPSMYYHWSLIIVSYSYYLDFRWTKHVFWNSIKLSSTGSIFFHFSGRAINGGLLMQRYLHLEGYVSSTLHYHWYEMASASCKMGLNRIDCIPSVKLVFTRLNLSPLPPTQRLTWGLQMK